MLGRLSVCLCLLDAMVSPAKTAEPIEVPFGMYRLMGSRNHVLHEGPDPPGKGKFVGGGKCGVMLPFL